MTKKQKLKVFEEYSIYAITDSKFSKKPLIQQAVEMVKGGVEIIQYREKYASFQQKYYECLEIRKITVKNNVLFIVNDHPDLALMVNADGIHLGQDDYPINVVKKIIKKDMIIGISTHSPKQYIQAVKDNADYVGVGPLFETHTKDNVMAPVGINYLKWVVKNKKIPFVAIGGIKLHNIEKVIKEGAKCICLVTEITTADDIPLKIKEIKKIFPK
ncbi:MAG: thiamine phosphate synthase [Elusimicrobiales bacterium]|nr:thiamine phosphate synthase [Elusimicrobiales bacterium]